MKDDFVLDLLPYNNPYVGDTDAVENTAKQLRIHKGLKEIVFETKKALYGIIFTYNELKETNVEEIRIHLYRRLHYSWSSLKMSIG